MEGGRNTGRWREGGALVTGGREGGWVSVTGVMEAKLSNEERRETPSYSSLR